MKKILTILAILLCSLVYSQDNLRSVDDSNYAVFSIINDLDYIYIKTPKKIKFRKLGAYNIESKNKYFFTNFFKKYN